MKSLETGIDAREIILTHEDNLTKQNLKGVKNKEDLSFGEPYKVIIFSKEIMYSLNNNSSDVENSIQNSPYYWEVPILKKSNNKPVSTCIIDKIENKWQIVEVGSNLTSDDINLSRNHKSITKLIRKNNITDIIDFAHIRIAEIGYDVLYIKSSKKEYFVPLNFEGNNSNKLKNKHLYSKESLSKEIKPLLANEDVNDSSELLFGGSALKETKPSLLERIVNLIVSIFK